MKKFLFLTLVSLLAGNIATYAQFSRYIIRLKDKTGTPFSISNPSAFLTQQGIDRRSRHSIPVDLSDLPITPSYIDSIRLSGDVIILNTSKWFNQVCIKTTDTAALARINSFSFVMASSPVAARASTQYPKKKASDPALGSLSSTSIKLQKPTDFFDYGVSYAQVHLHNAEFLHNHGFKGEGMRLALMDGGFYHYQSLPTFDSMRNNNQVKDTWDFVAGEASVNEDASHGMNCLSTIAANLPGSFVGTAPKGNFYLYRTEDASSEYPVEEQNWVAAAERADSLGVDVFSISLGYNTFDNSAFNYTYADMDGNTSLITRAVDLAAKKGILVVVAAGNEGNNNWHYITAPADADSVLTIGAVNVNRQVAAFSSYGPTSDGQTKPDVAAVGLGAVVANQNTGNPTFSNGTSFACPIMAGIASCLWQAFPELNNMTIIDELRRSGDKSVNPDVRTGFGIPDVKKAFVSILKKLYTQQVMVDNDCKANITGTVKAGGNMNIVIEKKLSNELTYNAVFNKSFNGGFSVAPFVYADDLSSLSSGARINYRVKMNIGTDTSFYLDSATIIYDRPCNLINEKITIGPNPVNDKLSILVASPTTVEASVIVYSVSGQTVYSNSLAVSGVQTIIIPMKHMSRGLYYVTVFIDNKKKLVKKIIRE